MPRKIINIDERAKYGKEKGDFLKILSTDFLDERDEYYSRCRKARENASLGFSAPYEDRVPQIARIYYEAVEDSLRLLFGVDVATYFSLMVFHNLYHDLKELGWKTIDRKTKRSDFNFFYYGRPGYVYRKEWRISFSHSAAYDLLFDGQREWKQQFGEFLAMNTEMCTMMIIADLESGVFENIYRHVEDSIGDAIRLSLIYQLTRDQMRTVDMRLIGAGEPPYYRLPQFGV